MSMSEIADDKIPLVLSPGAADGDEWNSTDIPNDGALVEVCAEDWRGQYLVPFPVRFIGDEWLNAATGEELDTYIAGWRIWRSNDV